MRRLLNFKEQSVKISFYPNNNLVPLVFFTILLSVFCFPASSMGMFYPVEPITINPKAPTAFAFTKDESSIRISWSWGSYDLHPIKWTPSTFQLTADSNSAGDLYPKLECNRCLL